VLENLGAGPFRIARSGKGALRFPERRCFWAGISTC